MGVPPNTAPSTGSGSSKGPDTLYEGAAKYLARSEGGTYNVVREYPWTLSKNKTLLEEVPYILLTEYAVDESTIQQQISYYTTAVSDAIASNTNVLAPYEKLFPRTPTGNVYAFPYFSDINLQVSTPQWQSLDNLEQGKKFAEGLGGLLFGETGAKTVGSLIEETTTLAGAALAAVYPKIGIMDRPKLWSSHDFRTIEIKFPLFNTVGPRDWIKNRILCWQLVNQNLFTKRDFITGIPPVYYELLVPGAHYSFASCVTNITIFNRGNMRTLLDDTGGPTIVPDVYEINITLTDMVMPSRNLFQAIRQKQSEVTVNNLRITPSAPTSETPAIARVANATLEGTGRATTSGGSTVLDLANRGANNVADFVSGLFNPSIQ